MMDHFFNSDTWGYSFWGVVGCIFLVVTVLCFMPEWESEEDIVLERRATNWSELKEVVSKEVDVRGLGAVRPSKPRFSPEKGEVKKLADHFAQVIKELAPTFTAYSNKHPGLAVFTDIVSIVKAVVAATGPFEESTHLHLLLVPLYGAVMNAAIDETVSEDAMFKVGGITALVQLNALRLCVAFDGLYGTQHSRMLGQGFLDLLTLTARSESTRCESKERVSLALSHEIRVLMPPESTNATGAWKEESCALLSVQRGCDLDELTEGWRKAVKMWHPDRLDDMAPELKEFATAKLSKINNAYDELKRNFDRDT